MSLEAGTRVGPFEIVEPIGAGAMGEAERFLQEAIRLSPNDASAHFWYTHPVC